MDETTLKILEYDAVAERAAANCLSKPGRAALLLERPACRREEAERELKRTREAFRVLFELGDKPISSFDSVQKDTEKVEKGGVLEPASLLRIARLLKTARILSEALADLDESFEELPRLGAEFSCADELILSIDRCVLNEDELSDDASPALAAARAKIRSVRNQIQEKLRRYVTGGEFADVLRERLVTVRDNRYVLPVKSEYKTSVSGILHDTSDSGATCYIEPIAIVELNNALKEAMAAEREEEERILRELSREVAMNGEAIRNNEARCTETDVIFAKAVFADQTKAVCPSLRDFGSFRLAGARHPLLDPVKAVPITVRMAEGKRILIVSGPNTGGKTVALKTIGLFCLMAYSGYFLPCEEAELPFFDEIFCDVGDNQSIRESLSTFGAHVKNLVRITDRATDRSLVLLDEPGAGTDPTEGAALAVATVRYLTKRGVSAVVTTHYGELKEYGLMTPSVENASMEFDPVTLLPTYRLKTGLPGVSNALGIAATLGLPDEILDDAKAYVGEGKRTFESVLGMADRARTEALDEKERLIAERRDFEKEFELLRKERARVEERYEKLEQNARSEIDKLVSKSEEHAEEILDQMRELLKDANEETLLRAKQLRTSLQKIEPPSRADAEKYEPLNPNALRVGNDVIVVSLGSHAKVKSLPDKRGRLDVSIGSMELKVSVGDLAVERFAKKESVKKDAPKVRHAAIASGFAATEINLLGQTVDEAILNTDAFLDQALIHGVGQVKIIHGLGTGALRKAIAQHLKRHRAVKEFRSGAYGEGGYGVTIVTLK